ncbi:hypothetical protein CTAYLR_009864 [Chrysophaeum taylorii]|uniref:NFACT RNA-binding domain-containing protein n=1 Tax=Chrysophaeum taylorii TaxID=2483200 RepID=A0AAD7U5M4_9STRA|nr:hypothetical protein CTAYLR_009864 [Chrysophaeum taylorii]
MSGAGNVEESRIPDEEEEDSMGPVRLALEKALEQERRKAASLRKEAEEAEKAEKLGRWAQLVVANMYQLSDLTKSVEVDDWETGEKVTLTFTKSPREDSEAAFARARRLRRGAKVVAELLAASERRLGDLERALDGDDLSASDLGIEAAGPSKKNKPFSRPTRRKWTGRTFVAPKSGVPVLVGRNRRENDYLSCVVAKDPDVWFHARGAAGAHVVLQLSKSKVADAPDEDVQFAANLAVFYSDLRDERKAVVARALPKHVWKPPRAPPGAVAIKKEEASVLGFPSDVPPDLIKRREALEYAAAAAFVDDDSAPAES